MNAFLIIDVQNDFCPGGKLAVPNGDQIVQPINALVSEFDHVILTQDWHPQEHLSFASNHDKEPYETIEMPYGEQILWPDHCVQGTDGAEFHPDLNTDAAHAVIRKGFNPEIDSYSAFFENDKSTPTGLQGYLSSKGITRLFIAGLATDFCVKWSVLDALQCGFETFLFTDAIAGIDLNDSVFIAMEDMKQAGVQMISTTELSTHLSL
jgi:nicotinamidase/pyrazinamidase